MPCRLRSRPHRFSITSPNGCAVPTTADEDFLLRGYLSTSRAGCARPRAKGHLLPNYLAGIGTYLQVLVADEQYLLARTAYVEGVAQRLEDTVAIYVALGGGWWHLPM